MVVKFKSPFLSSFIERRSLLEHPTYQDSCVQVEMVISGETLTFNQFSADHCGASMSCLASHKSSKLSNPFRRRRCNDKLPRKKVDTYNWLLSIESDDDDYYSLANSSSSSEYRSVTDKIYHIHNKSLHGENNSDRGRCSCCNESDELHYACTDILFNDSRGSQAKTLVDQSNIYSSPYSSDYSDSHSKPTNASLTDFDKKNIFTSAGKFSAKNSKSDGDEASLESLPEYFYFDFSDSGVSLSDLTSD